jgi:hypothetical protein
MAPSVERIQAVMDLTPDEAQEVRDILDLELVRGERSQRESHSVAMEYEVWHDAPSRKLYMIDRALRSAEGGQYFGVELLRSKDDTPHEFLGIAYLNAGDPYVGTLAYDYKRECWRLGGWGDMIELPGNRGRFE